MRAKEFTINVPINIKINGDGDPEIDVTGQSGEHESPPLSTTQRPVKPKQSSDDSELDQNPVMISPQQQELELKKAEQGKGSPYIDDLTDDDPDVGDNEDYREVGSSTRQRRSR